MMVAKMMQSGAKQSSQINITELRTEGQIAVNKNMRIGFYCLEAANEIERLRQQNLWLAEKLSEEALEVGKLNVEITKLRKPSVDSGERR